MRAMLIATLAALATTVTSAIAADLGNVPGIDIPGTAATSRPVLKVAERPLRLLPLSLADLGANAKRDVPARPAGAVAKSTGLEANVSVPVLPLKHEIVRVLDDVWELSTPSDAIGSAMADVSISIQSADGRWGGLSLDSQPGTFLPVELVELPPRGHIDERGRSVELGRIELRIPTSQIKAAGRYRGRIVVTMQGF